MSTKNSFETLIFKAFLRKILLFLSEAVSHFFFIFQLKYPSNYFLYLPISHIFLWFFYLQSGVANVICRFIEQFLLLVFSHFEVFHPTEGGAPSRPHNVLLLLHRGRVRAEVVGRRLGDYSLAVVKALHPVDGVEALASHGVVRRERGHWRLLSLDRGVQLVLDQVLPVFHGTWLWNFAVSGRGMCWVFCNISGENTFCILTREHDETTLLLGRIFRLNLKWT